VKVASSDVFCRVEHHEFVEAHPWHWAVSHSGEVTAGACDTREQAWACIESVLKGVLRLRRPGRGRLGAYMRD